MEKKIYRTEDGKSIPMEQMLAMGDEEFLATLSPDTKAFFTAQPEMLKAFRAYAAGDSAGSDKIIRDRVADSENGGKPLSIDMVLDLMESLRAKQKKNPGEILIEILGLDQLEGGLGQAIGDKLKAAIKEELQKSEAPLTPEQEVENTKLETEGVNFHFTKDHMEALLNIITDAHRFIIEKTEELDELSKMDKSRSKMLDIANRRHQMLHDFQEAVDEQFAKQYPTLIEGVKAHHETVH